MRVSTIVLVCVMASCAAAPPVVDAGEVDAGAIDAGEVDAGAIDAGVIDAGLPDAGVVDAGVFDAGSVDSGVVDAGVMDAGVADAGPVDAGALDSGVVDAGVFDAGLVDAGVPRPVGCVTSVAAGHRVFSCQGISYDTEISTACASGGCGLIVDIHGLTMNASLQEKSTGLRAMAPIRGFVVVQPTAPSGLIGPSWTPGADDTKVWSFITDVRAALRIDPARVHLTGFSQGGAMTWRLVCQHADEIASAAPIAAADGQTQQPAMGPYTLDCPFTAMAQPSRQLPLLHLHGISDGLVPIAKGRQQRDAVLSTWSLPALTVIGGDMKYTHWRSTNAMGTVYEYVEHSYAVDPPFILVPLGGHCIPGGQDLRANAPFGQTMFFSCATPSFSWGSLVLDFFIAHPKP